MPAIHLTQIDPGASLVRPPDPPGHVNILCSVLDGKIIMDFHRSLMWVGMTPVQADKLAEDLKDAARLARTLHLPQG
jgi:hypothetical protein